jgi:acyl carrier protein
VRPELHFPDDLGPDSLDAVELVMAYEEAFDDEITQEEMERIRRLRTTQEVLDYLRKRKKGGHLN